MPPKKKVASDENTEAGGVFRWTLENERKLLILTQGRYLTSEDYERLVPVFPGTNLNGVKIRVSRLRVEQRNLYEQLGWQLPEGAAGHSGGKRKKATAQGEEAETPSKKPRAKKGKKEESGSEGNGDGDGAGVKEEQIEGNGDGVEVKEEQIDAEA